MAEEIQENKSKKSGNLILIIIVGVLVLLLVVGGLVAFLLLSSSDTPQAQSQPMQQNVSTQKQQQRVSDYVNIGIMLPLDQFIVNLLSENGGRFLKTSMNLELNSENLIPEIDKKKPLIRDIIIRLLSSKTYEEVSTSKGKERLKDEIVGKLNEVLTDGHIRNLYFTDFVVQ